MSSRIPSQTALIEAAGVVAGEITLFFVENIYDLFTPEHAGGEAFFASQAAAPAAIPAAVISLNEQLRAMNLATALYGKSLTVGSRSVGNWLLDVLDAARAAALVASDSDILLQARAFWTAADTARTATPFPSRALLLLQLQTAAVPSIPYDAATLTTRMADAHGCAFLVARPRLESDLAPAHELTHITTNFNNVADGHYDLENPLPSGTDVVGSNLPGLIDGKNLMHRYALDAGNPSRRRPAQAPVGHRSEQHASQPDVGDTRSGISNFSEREVYPALLRGNQTHARWILSARARVMSQEMV